MEIYDKRIFLTGHNGMVGSACLKKLKIQGFKNVITVERTALDLRDYSQVYKFLKNEKPEIIVNAAAVVGGILANDSYPYDFLMDNMRIQNSLIDSANQLNISKFIFLGSSCIYPKYSNQPIREEYLLSSSLEPTNQWYALAKISGLKAIEAANIQYSRRYLSLMPTNLYGPNDNFDLQTSHVLPAMIKKFHDAKVNKLNSVELWGSGSPYREFLHVDDLADAVLFFILKNYKSSLYNVGSGKEIQIKELAKLIKKTVNFQGSINWDLSKPDGTPKKLMDSSRINKLGWKPKISLKEGIESTYEWFINNSN